MLPDPHTHVPMCMCEHIHKKRTWCLHDSNKKNDKALRNITDRVKGDSLERTSLGGWKSSVNVGLHTHRSNPRMFRFWNNFSVHQGSLEEQDGQSRHRKKGFIRLDYMTWSRWPTTAAAYQRLRIAWLPSQESRSLTLKQLIPRLGVSSSNGDQLVEE